jgi:hypothetical protein
LFFLYAVFGSLPSVDLPDFDANGVQRPEHWGLENGARTRLLQCLDCLNYDRLGICDLDRHLADGGVEVEGWIRDYGYVPRASEG